MGTEKTVAGHPESRFGARSGNVTDSESNWPCYIRDEDRSTQRVMHRTHTSRQAESLKRTSPIALIPRI